MTKRLWLVLLCSFAPLSTVAAESQQALPNFLLIFVDDQGWSGTPVPMIPGNDKSRTAAFLMPNLETLAKQGMTFSQAYASHPKCECSRAGLQMGRSTTSLNAVDKRARNWNAPVTDSLANTLKRANPNYRAAHFGKWQWPTPPEAFGYDASDGVTQNADGDTTDPDDPKQSFSLTRRATAYLDKQVRDGHPFYLQLSYYAVHSRPQALAGTLKKYQSENSASAKGGREGGPVVAAMTEDLDTCIGTLLEKLRQLKIANNTYVIYMSDNGGQSPALKGGKALCDEGGIRVPLIVTGPGIGGGAYCNEPVVGYDIFPTILDLAGPGTALPKGIEGGSWKAVLLGSGIGNVQRPINRLVWHHDVEIDHPQTALRKGNFKLLHYWDTKQDFLYDLSVDLAEAHDLATTKPALTAQLLMELKSHVRSGLGEQRFATLESGKFDQQPRPADGKGKGGKKGEGKKGDNKRSPT